MKQYKLIKTYPNSPELGTIVYFNKFLKKYFSEYLDRNISQSEVENFPEFWEKYEYPKYEINTIVKDLISGYEFKKSSDWIWTANIMINEREIGIGKRFKLVEFS